MKCIKFYSDGKVVRVSEDYAKRVCGAEPGIPESPIAFFVSRAEWKDAGHKRSGPQDGAPISDHPRKGSPPRHRGNKKKKR